MYFCRGHDDPPCKVPQNKGTAGNKRFELHITNKTDDKYCVLTYQFTQIAILKVLSYSSPTGPPLIGDSIPYWLYFELCVIIDPVVLKIVGVSSVKNPRTILIGG